MNKTISRLLAELEKTRGEFWNISKETGLFLNELIRSTPSIKKILEIGTSNGVSAIWMAEALKAKAKIQPRDYPGIDFPQPENIGSPGTIPGQDRETHHLYTIESHFKRRFPLATANFAKAGLTPYITQILGHAPEVIPPTPRLFDLIFLDATKYEHPLYLDAIINRLSKNGIIITDNAISHKKELTPYFKKLRKLNDHHDLSHHRLPFFETHLIEIGSGLLISVKTY